MHRTDIAGRLWVRHDLPPYLIRALWLRNLDAVRRRRPGRNELRSSLRPVFLVLGVGLQHEIADTFLGVRVDDWPKQREAAPVTVDDVLARREGDVAAT